MNRSELIDVVAKDAGLSKAAVGRVLSTMINAIRGAVAVGETVILNGLGTFELVERTARTHKHPKTGAAVKRPATVEPKFTADSTLRNQTTVTGQFTVGLISDTHDVLRPDVVAALKGSDFIIHTGNIGSSQVLEDLAILAPVIAVRGGNDGVWAMSLPESTILDVGALRLLVTHTTSGLDVNHLTASCDVVVTGHTHRPGTAFQDGVLFVSPGGCGPDRPGIGRLVIQGRTAALHLIELDTDQAT